MKRSLTVAVIGAGVSGLAASKTLLEAGITPVVYESSNVPGGLWVYRDRTNIPSPAYRSLRANTSKQVTALSDFPFPNDAPDFPLRAGVESYLQRYAAAFHVGRHIRFGHQVQCVTPQEDGRWFVELAGANRAQPETFDAVLVASGIFREGVVPEIPGLDTFPGKSLHSRDYCVPEPFAGQNVLVVGLGSSAADIAIDLAGVARSVTLSTRRGAWVAPRFVAGYPIDHLGTRLSALLPRKYGARRAHMIAAEWARRGIEPTPLIWERAHIPFDPLTAPRVTSDNLLPLARSGQIGLRPGIDHIDGLTVTFADGNRLVPDAIIFATGYRLSFPFLPPALRPWTPGGTGLYRLVFPPGFPTLAFVGVCRVHGPVLPLAEMQARWIARVLTGQAHLPPPEVMRTEIARRRAMRVASHESVIQVTLLPSLDEIARDISVQPRLWRHPLLLENLLTGPPVAAQFRLDGPGRWPGASHAIRASARGTPS